MANENNGPKVLILNNRPAEDDAGMYVSTLALWMHTSFVRIHAYERSINNFEAAVEEIDPDFMIFIRVSPKTIEAVCSGLAILDRGKGILGIYFLGCPYCAEIVAETIDAVYLDDKTDVHKLSKQLVFLYSIRGLSSEELRDVVYDCIVGASDLCDEIKAPAKDQIKGDSKLRELASDDKRFTRDGVTPYEYLFTLLYRKIGLDTSDEDQRRTQTVDDLFELIVKAAEQAKGGE